MSSISSLAGHALSVHCILAASPRSISEDPSLLCTRSGLRSMDLGSSK